MIQLFIWLGRKNVYVEKMKIGLVLLAGLCQNQMTVFEQCAQNRKSASKCIFLILEHIS
jgi:hypothetical protein